MSSLFTSETQFLELTEKVPITSFHAEKINIEWETFCREKYRNWNLFKGKYYYFKKLNNLKLLNNLIFSKIVQKYYKLKVADYRLAKVNNEIGLASINFRQSNDIYFNADMEHFPSFDPSITFTYLKTFFEQDKNYNRLVYELTKLISFHIYAGLDDLCSVNLLFKEECDGFSLATIFDLDDAFENVIMDWYYEYNSYICDFEIPSNRFTTFIGNFPVFKKALYIQNDIDISKILIEVEQENKIQITELLKDFYKREDEKKKGFIRGLKL